MILYHYQYQRLSGFFHINQMRNRDSCYYAPLRAHSNSDFTFTLPKFPSKVSFYSMHVLPRMIVMFDFLCTGSVELHEARGKWSVPRLLINRKVVFESKRNKNFSFWFCLLPLCILQLDCVDRVYEKIVICILQLNHFAGRFTSGLDFHSENNKSYLICPHSVKYGICVGPKLKFCQI